MKSGTKVFSLPHDERSLLFAATGGRLGSVRAAIADSDSFGLSADGGMVTTMISKAIGIVLIAILLLMVGFELGRYFRLRVRPDDIPYPGGRLLRRMLMALIFAGVVGLVVFWPPVPPWAGLGLIVLSLVGVLIGLYLLGRDFRETSREALDRTSRLKREAGESLKVLLTEAGKKRRDTKKQP
ncbi:MAG: energy-coupling factor transporter transmembrane protein EcfT [bacterium]|nr:energy-coupling factor transporter transmembrane protein EcfT [bacterium]